MKFIVKCIELETTILGKVTYIMKTNATFFLAYVDAIYRYFCLN